MSDLTHAELDGLLEDHRKGAMLPGSAEHEAFVVSAVEYMPRLIEAARSVAKGEVLLEVHIPGLVPPSPNQTRREQWPARSRRFKSEKNHVRLALFAAHGDFGPAIKLPITVTFTRCSTRLLDQDNLFASMKAPIDAAAEWLGIDDRDARVTWRVEQKMVKKAGAGTIVRIEARAGGTK